MSTKSICGALALVSMMSISFVSAAPKASKDKPAAAPAAAQPAAQPGIVWKIDSGHTTADFSVRHLMISNVKGHFSKVSGNVNYDGKDLKSIKIDAAIEVASVDTGENGRDEHLKNADFFDATKFPTMTFKSKKVKSAGKGKFTVLGDLTIKGVTKEVTLDVEGPTEQIKDMQGGTRVGASATTKINRKDFGITWNKALDNGSSVVGDDVKVSIEVEAVKQK
ncbi:MAG: YceI family protein [Candidatus Melainabacteria bacterium]|nr:YceI family protein [Candidatus Melainabacteria bacterium]